MNHKWIIVYDFETDDSDPKLANPTELAAVAVHPRTLEIQEKDIFKVNIQPQELIDDPEAYAVAKAKTINFHAKTRNCTAKDILDTWNKGVSESVAMKCFLQYCKKYHVEKNVSIGLFYPEPVYSGYNVDKFDDIILNRVLDRHGMKYPFAKTGNMDLYTLICFMFENLSEPDKLGMDSLKEFLGLKSYGQAHEASSDVMDTAKILVRFMEFLRKQSKVSKFKGKFA